MYYNKDCRAALGAYVQTTTKKVVTNENPPRTYGYVVLGLSGNRQGSLECADLKTCKWVVRRLTKQMPWPDRIPKVVDTWGLNRKKTVIGDFIQFLN